MAHYHIEIKGHSPLGIERLREQRDALTQLTVGSRSHLITDTERLALRGIRQLCHAIIDTHDRAVEVDPGKAEWSARS